MTDAISLDDIITNGKELDARTDGGAWWLMITRIAAWLVVEGTVGRHVGRTHDVTVGNVAREALRTMPEGARLTWRQHPWACIDPLVTPGYVLDFSTWRRESYWMLKFARTDDDRVRITETEQWIEGPPGVERVTDEKKTEEIVDEPTARARADQVIREIKPRVERAG